MHVYLLPGKGFLRNLTQLSCVLWSMPFYWSLFVLYIAPQQYKSSSLLLGFYP